MANPATSSGIKNADAAISANGGRLYGLQVFADGTNQATVTLYDNATQASGLVLCQVIVDAGLVYEDANMPNQGIVVNNGIYADVTGTGATYLVTYGIS